MSDPWVDLWRGARDDTTMAGNSGSAFQLSDGKMLSVIKLLHYETDSDAIYSSGFKARSFLLDPVIHAHGSPSLERLVWTVLVV